MSELLTCVLLQELEDIIDSIDCDGLMREILDNDLSCMEKDMWNFAFFEKNTLESLNIDVDSQNLIKIENNDGGRLYVRAKVLNLALCPLLNAWRINESYCFVYGCSSVNLQPGRLHNVTRIIPGPKSSLIYSATVQNLTLARLCGQLYPNHKGSEDAMLKAWFGNSQARLVRSGDVTPVCFQVQDSQAHTPSEYLRPLGKLVCWYRVLEVKVGDVGKDDCAFTWTTPSTSIYLNEAHVSLDLAHINWKFSRYLYSFENICDIKFFHGLKQLPSTLNLTCIMHSDNTPHVSGIRKGGNTVTSVTLHEHLTWAFQQAQCNGVGSTPHASVLSSAHTAGLIQTLNSVDILMDSAQFAESKGFKFFNVEYRDFLYAAYETLLSRKAGAVDKTHIKRFTQQFPQAITPSYASHVSCHAFDIDTWKKNLAPCVVCITGLENVLRTERSTANKVKTIADSLLCDFIHTVYCCAQRGGVLMIGTTTSLRSLSDIVVEHFPIHLVDDTSSALCSQRQSNSNDARTRLHVLRDRISEMLGKKHMTQFVQELRLYQLQSSSFSSWESHAFSSVSVELSIPLASERNTKPFDLSEEDILSVAKYAQHGHWGVSQLPDSDDCNLSKVLASQDVANVSWDDVGGVDEIRRELIGTLELISQPQVLHGKIPRRTGVLLYGPPGTGKTLIAKAVATECNMSFLSVKGPELLDMYIGESEHRIRLLFDKAKRLQPCVLFFDELDSLAPARGHSLGGGSSGVLDRVVSQLLIELDNLGCSEGAGDNTKLLNGSRGIFVIGATNRPDLLDSALLRPGRFDKKVYLGPSICRDSKLKILVAQTKSYAVQSRFNTLEEVSKLLGETPITGAELGAIVSTAHEFALNRKIEELKNISAVNMNDPSGNDGVNSYDVDCTCRISEYLHGVECEDELLDVEITLLDFECAIGKLNLTLATNDTPAHAITFSRTSEKEKVDL